MKINIPELINYSISILVMIIAIISIKNKAKENPSLKILNFPVKDLLLFAYLGLGCFLILILTTITIN